jgi:hypothetical protein
MEARQIEIAKRRLAYEFSLILELVAEGSISWGQQSEYEFGVRFPAVCIGIGSGVEKLMPLKHATKQLDTNQSLCVIMTVTCSCLKVQ